MSAGRPRSTMKATWPYSVVLVAPATVPRFFANDAVKDAPPSFVSVTVLPDTVAWRPALAESRGCGLVAAGDVSAAGSAVPRLAGVAPQPAVGPRGARLGVRALVWRGAPRPGRRAAVLLDGRRTDDADE